MRSGGISVLSVNLFQILTLISQLIKARKNHLAKDVVILT